MAGKLPPLWASLMSKAVTFGDIPQFQWEPWYWRDTRSGKIINETTSEGYFVRNLEQFNNMFFGISPKEALLMDPQQKNYFECHFGSFRGYRHTTTKLSRFEYCRLQ